MDENNPYSMMSALLQNNMMLPRDVFNYKDEMHDDVRAHLEKVICFVQEKFLSFLAIPIKDVVVFGKMCTSVNRSDTKIDIAFVAETKLPFLTRENVMQSIQARGYHFWLYNHEIFFHFLLPDEVIGANWSILNKKWNQKPQIRQFSFNLEDFFRAYSLYAKETHDILDHLPRTADGFHTPDSCQKIRQYLKYLEDNAKFALKNHPQHEYSMPYNLFLAFDEIFGVKNFFQDIVAKAESHFLEDTGDE